MRVEVRGWALRFDRASIAQCVRLAPAAAALAAMGFGARVVHAQDTTVARLAQKDSARGDKAAGDTTRRADSTSLSQRIARLYRRYPWLPRFVGSQFTYTWQDVPPFNAPYSGPNSLTPHGDEEGTHTYGLYFGAGITPRLQLYADFEMARGAAIGHAVGLAGLTNGDVIRQGAVNLGQGPYLARSYLRYLIPLGAGVDTVDRAQDQVPDVEPTHRIEIKAGKFALNDDIDQNRYADATRYQFMDWSLWNNTAWDFAANTRGYSNEILVGYVSPAWSLKLAAAQMPTFANGNVLDNDLADAYGLNGELTVRPDDRGTVLRLLAYDNRGRMGIYRQAIDIARAADTVPNIVADDRKGRAKYGFGLNVEQPLADSGNTGVFARLGWNDGRTEDFVFTEVDRVASGGVQVAGNAWHRPMDRFGLAAAVEGLSEDHENYLAAGGLGFVLGDGKLRYEPEQIVEADYRIQLPILSFAELTPAIQHVQNPGYNADRGPLYVYTVRVNLHY
jgi:high affinity Mn2+ porin